MKTYRYCTDTDSGTIEAESIVDALAQIAPTEEQIENGGFAWVENPETMERLAVGEQNAF